MPEAVRAAVLVAPERFEIAAFPVPSIGPEEGLIDVELCGVCGTDLKYASGQLPAPYPIILGHEVVGRIAAIGAAAADRYGVAVGDRVLVESSIPCWHCEACRSGAYRLCPTKGGYGTRTSTAVPPGLWGGMAEEMFIAHVFPLDDVASAIAAVKAGLDGFVKAAVQPRPRAAARPATAAA